MNYQRQRQRGFGAGGERNVSQESTKTSKIASETIAWTPGRLEEAHGMTIPNETMESAIWGENRITPQELDAARQTVRRFPGLSRSELARTICEHWGWVTASGSHKVTDCLKVLEELWVLACVGKGRVHHPM